jgi:DNA-binding NarL/FixJ family response regulator
MRKTPVSGRRRAWDIQNGVFDSGRKEDLFLKTRILLVDDHAILRDGLRNLLETQQDLDVVGEASDGRTAVERVAELSPDVVIMDITMPDLNGIEATRKIVAGGSGAKVIALSMHSNRAFLADMLKAGASGYLMKTSSGAELLTAIRTVAGGQVYLGQEVTQAVVTDYVRHVPAGHDAAFATLTPRERQVLQLVAEGRTTKDIAARLSVSVKTIETHRSQIMDRLRIHSVARLTKFAIQEGLTSPEP